MKLDDKTIVEELRKDNEQVYRSLFDIYFYPLTEFAFRFVYDRDACMDIVQEVYVNLWEHRLTQEIKSFKWYLYTAVKNRCLSYLRDIGVKDKHQIYLIDCFLSQHSDHNLLDAHLVKELNQALDQLPKEMKSIFLLKYEHGLTLKEISEDLNISINTVKTQLRRAKLKLRNLLCNRSLLLLCW